MTATMFTANPPATSDPSVAAQAQADNCLRDDAQAQAKGSTPEQRAARHRVAQLFCEIHLASDAPEARSTRLAVIDYSAPVAVINGRGVDLQNPKAKGFLGLGRKPVYLVSTRFIPQKPEDPIYALEYIPVKA